MASFSSKISFLCTITRFRILLAACSSYVPPKKRTLVSLGTKDEKKVSQAMTCLGGDWPLLMSKFTRVTQYLHTVSVLVYPFISDIDHAGGCWLLPWWQTHEIYKSSSPAPLNSIFVSYDSISARDLLPLQLFN